MNRSVPGLKLAEWSRQLGLRIAAGPTNAFVQQKRLARESMQMGFGAVLESEARLQAELVQMPEYAEGLAGFIEKRRPDFRSLRPQPKSR